MGLCCSKPARLHSGKLLAKNRVGDHLMATILNNVYLYVSFFE